MELDRAKAVVALADKLIDSAKVEVDFLRVVGGTEGTEFIPDGGRKALPPARRSREERESKLIGGSE